MVKITVLTSLYRCSAYIKGYFEFLRKLNRRDDLEVLLLHNDPTDIEMSIIKDNLVDLPFVKHIIIPEREDLYVTWNRGIRLAQGEYIAIWNVDDIRFSGSIDAQAATLDADSNILLTYGDIYYMYKYPEVSTTLWKNKDYLSGVSSFLSSHQIGCFPMWRKCLHKQLGYFDEQFKLVSDFDFQIRIARTGRIKKTNSILGAYLEYVPEKLSSNTKRQLVERNVVYLRYAILDKFNWLTAFSIAGKYRISCIKTDSCWIHVSSIFNDYRLFCWKRFPKIFLSVFVQPRGWASYLKHVVFNL